jgi:hypothetical protein
MFREAPLVEQAWDPRQPEWSVSLLREPEFSGPATLSQSSSSGEGAVERRTLLLERHRTCTVQSTSNELRKPNCFTIGLRQRKRTLYGLFPVPFDRNLSDRPNLERQYG